MNNMRMKDEQVRDALAAQAAEWFVINRRAPGSAEREEFLNWLKSSPTNVEEYLGVAQVAQDLMASAPAASEIDALVERARREGDQVVRALPAQVTRTQEFQGRGWNILAVATAIVATVSASLLMWHRNSTVPAPLTAAQLHLQTRNGMQITQRLRDSSVLHLNTDSDVLVRYDAKGRWVTINRGQVTFEVAHDPQHPFHVLAGVAEVTARGTVFDVRLNDDSTVVTVVEGRVVVEPTAGDQDRPTFNKEGGQSATGSRPRTPVEVGADQQLRVSATDWQEAPSAVDAHHATAWLRHQIAFENEPLADVAAEFNRYNTARIEIETAQLRELRISGVFAENDPEAFVAFLRSLHGVRVEVTPTRIRVYSPTGHSVLKHQ
jgi:transmembrane sensor